MVEKAVEDAVWKNPVMELLVVAQKWNCCEIFPLALLLVALPLW
jgi:hypothetical protein